MFSDNGPGIPNHLLGKVFEAFVSSRLDAKGTGLGLTVAEGIVNQHGGTITAANRPPAVLRLKYCCPRPDLRKWRERNRSGAQPGGRGGAG